MPVKPNIGRRAPQSGFVPLKTSDERVDRNFAAVQSEIESMRGIFSAATLHEGIVPAGASATIVISHGLGRPYRGWLCTRTEGDVALAEVTIIGGQRDRVLSLAYTGSATNKLSILVF